MLSTSDVALMREHILSSEQDYFLLKNILGEPFFVDGYLFYFDGETLFGVAIPFFVAPPFSHVAYRLVKKHRPRRVDITAYNDFERPHLEEFGLRPIFESESEPWNCELFLDLVGASRRRLVKRQRELLNRNKSNLQCKLNRAGLSAKHFSLLRSFCRRHAISSSSFDPVHLSFSTCALIGHLDGVTLDLFLDGELVGFAQGHTHYAPRLGIFSFCIFEPNVRYASDLLYSAMIDKMISAGVRMCSIGLAMNRGLLSYKSKWGSYPALSYFRQTIWGRESGDSIAYHWPHDLFRLRE